MFPNITQNAVPFTPDNTINQDRQAHWEVELSKEAQQRKATAAASKSLNPAEVEALARTVFAEIAPKARDHGVDLYERENELVLRLIDELSDISIGIHFYPRLGRGYS